MGKEDMLSMLGKIHLLNIIALMNQDENTAFGQTHNVCITLSTIGKIFLKRSLTGDCTK